jgi:hypothetical protein
LGESGEGSWPAYSALIKSYMLKIKVRKKKIVREREIGVVDGAL